MTDETMGKALKALADPTRLRIIQELSECGGGDAGLGDDPTAGELCCRLTGADRISSTVSHHLHELADAGLIRLSRRGRSIVCSLRPEGLRAVARSLDRLAGPPMKSTHVLFVCVHNAGRSQMAEAFTNHLARERGLPVTAESAGTVGGKALNAVAAAAMAEIGVTMDGQSPKLMDQAMADRADRIISMGCGVDAEACPANFLLTEDWGLVDPAGGSFEAVSAIRDQVRTHVERMLDGLVT